MSHNLTATINSRWIQLGSAHTGTRCDERDGALQSKPRSAMTDGFSLSARVREPFMATLLIHAGHCIVHQKYKGTVAESPLLSYDRDASDRL